MNNEISNLHDKSLNSDSFVLTEEKTAKKGHPVVVGSVTIGGPEFTVIAGPCSIESRAQFLETAEFVKLCGAAFLRGGIWKLRTSADSFQGLGAESLEMIKEVCEKVNLPLCSEVTDARQIEC